MRAFKMAAVPHWVSQPSIADPNPEKFPRPPILTLQPQPVAPVSFGGFDFCPKRRQRAATGSFTGLGAQISVWQSCLLKWVYGFVLVSLMKA